MHKLRSKMLAIQWHAQQETHTERERENRRQIERVAFHPYYTVPFMFNSSKWDHANKRLPYMVISRFLQLIDRFSLLLLVLLLWHAIQIKSKSETWNWKEKYRRCTWAKVFIWAMCLTCFLYFFIMYTIKKNYLSKQSKNNATFELD